MAPSLQGALCPCASLLLFRVVLLLVTDVIVVHQVAEGLGGDGHHVGQDDSAVAAAAEHQLVMRVVVAHVPHPVEERIAGVTFLRVASARRPSLPMPQLPGSSGFAQSQQVELSLTLQREGGPLELFTAADASATT